VSDALSAEPSSRTQAEPKSRRNQRWQRATRCYPWSISENRARMRPRQPRSDQRCTPRCRRGPPKWPARGLAANENACALISMVARSTARSNRRPDTLMQERKPTDRRKPLATHGRSIHWVRLEPIDRVPANGRNRRNLAARTPLRERLKSTLIRPFAGAIVVNGGGRKL